MGRLPSSIEGTADVGTGANPISFYCAEKIIFIANDDLANSIRVNFNAPASSTQGIELKAGETINDIPIPEGSLITSVYIEGILGAANFRGLGV